MLTISLIYKLHGWINFSHSALFHTKARVSLKYFVTDCRFQSSASTNNFDFLDQIYPKKVFMFENRKSEHHHWILHIRIVLGTKFQLRLTIFIFWANLPKKGVSGLKLKDRIFACVHGRFLLFCTRADRHNKICNKRRQRRVRRLLMRVKPRIACINDR